MQIWISAGDLFQTASPAFKAKNSRDVSGTVSSLGTCGRLLEKQQANAWIAAWDWAGAHVSFFLVVLFVPRQADITWRRRKVAGVAGDFFLGAPGRKGRSGGGDLTALGDLKCRVSEPVGRAREHKRKGLACTVLYLARCRYDDGAALEQASVNQGTAVRRPVPRGPGTRDRLAQPEGNTQSTYNLKHGVREAVRATSTAARMRDAEGFLGDAAFSMRLADRAEQELELERICVAAGLNPPCNPDPAALSSDRVQRDGG